MSDLKHIFFRGVEVDPFPCSADRIDIRGELPKVLANEAGLTQCFSNLMTNAVKFVEPGKVPVLLDRTPGRPLMP